MSDDGLRFTQRVCHALVVSHLVDDIRGRVSAMPANHEQRRFVAKLDVYSSAVRKWVGVPPSDAQRLAMYDKLVELLDEVRTATWMRAEVDADARVRRAEAVTRRLGTGRRVTADLPAPSVRAGVAPAEKTVDPEGGPTDSAVRRSSRIPPKRHVTEELPRGRVDAVGERAVALAELARSTGSAVPSVIVPARSLAAAPLSSLEAYLVSRIDGRATVSELADVLGLKVPRLLAMLDRLARLGLISL